MLESIAGYAVVPTGKETGFGTELAVLDPRDGSPFAILREWTEPWEDAEPLYAAWGVRVQAVRFLNGTSDLEALAGEIRSIALDDGVPVPA